MQDSSNAEMHIEKISRTHWRVQLNNAVTSTDGENISIKVVLPISESSIGDVQQQAIRRAVKLLSSFLEKP